MLLVLLALLTVTDGGPSELEEFKARVNRPVAVTVPGTDRVQVLSDRPYGPGDKAHRFDAYLPERRTGKAPVVLLVHAGWAPTCRSARRTGVCTAPGGGCSRPLATWPSPSTTVSASRNRCWPRPIRTSSRCCRRSGRSPDRSEQIRRGSRSSPSAREVRCSRDR